MPQTDLLGRHVEHNTDRRIEWQRRPDARVLVSTARHVLLCGEHHPVAPCIISKCVALDHRPPHTAALTHMLALLSAAADVASLQHEPGRRPHSGAAGLHRVKWERKPKTGTLREVVAGWQQVRHAAVGVGARLADRVPGGAAAALRRALQADQHPSCRPPQRRVQHVAGDGRHRACNGCAASPSWSAADAAAPTCWQAGALAGEHARTPLHTQLAGGMVGVLAP